jgi:hypothetical protein
MGYHIGHIDSFMLDPFQGRGKIMEIGSRGPKTIDSHPGLVYTDF